jgi:hypothetical protein
MTGLGLGLPGSSSSSSSSSSSRRCLLIRLMTGLGLGLPGSSSSSSSSCRCVLIRFMTGSDVGLGLLASGFSAGTGGGTIGGGEVSVHSPSEGVHEGFLFLFFSEDETLIGCSAGELAGELERPYPIPKNQN